MIDKAELNEDGKVSYTESFINVIKVQQEQVYREKFKALFSQVDKEGRGKISREHIQEAI